MSGIFEVLLRRATGHGGSPGIQRRQRRVMDTSTCYVRGEENLDGWRPRGDSLIFDHQWELEKLARIQAVGLVRYWLLLRERLGLDSKTPGLTVPSSVAAANGNIGAKMKQDFTKSEKEMCNMMAKAEVIKPDGSAAPVLGLKAEGVDPYQPWQMTDRERELATKYVNLIQGKRMKKDPSLLSLTPLGVEAGNLQAHSNPLSPDTPSGPVPGMPSPGQESRAFVPNASHPVEPSSSTTGGQVFVADIEEVRVSPVVSRRGLLSVLEKGALGWVRRWVVVRRPYVLLFKDEKDCIERGLINLSTAIVEYSEDQEDVNGMVNAFR